MRSNMLLSSMRLMTLWQAFRKVTVFAHSGGNTTERKREKAILYFIPLSIYNAHSGNSLNHSHNHHHPLPPLLPLFLLSSGPVILHRLLSSSSYPTAACLTVCMCTACASCASVFHMIHAHTVKMPDFNALLDSSCLIVSLCVRPTVSVMNLNRLSRHCKSHASVCSLFIALYMCVCALTCK